MHQPKDSTKV